MSWLALALIVWLVGWKLNAWLATYRRQLPPTTQELAELARGQLSTTKTSVSVPESCGCKAVRISLRTSGRRKVGMTIEIRGQETCEPRRAGATNILF